MRVLVAGWFSLGRGGATAGDLLARDVACEWLKERGVPYEVAEERALGPGVDWFRVAPERYSHLLFVSGPVGPELEVAPLVERFAACRRIALNVSVAGDRAWRPFDVTLERDGLGGARADLALAAPARRPPVVARVHSSGPLECPPADPEAVHAAFDRLLAGLEAAALDVDTRLARGIPGRRSAGEVEALVGVADVVLTAQPQGLVLALRAGIPALAVDAVPGGAALLAQARVLGWPAAVALDALDDAVLGERFAWCLGDEARALARSTAQRGLEEVGAIRGALEQALG
jgi:hypothetical protein